jgi:hypothetical protein
MTFTANHIHGTILLNEDLLRVKYVDCSNILISGWLVRYLTMLFQLQIFLS